ncbi:MAG: EamA family transporter, partial [Lachnospiraceae bacterium]
MEKKQLRSNLLLVLTALIWGAAFVAQSVGMDYVGPFTFNAARFMIGGAVLIP